MAWRGLDRPADCALREAWAGINRDGGFGREILPGGRHSEFARHQARQPHLLGGLDFPERGVAYGPAGVADRSATVVG